MSMLLKYRTQRNCCQGLVVVCDLMVGFMVIRTWKTAVTMMKPLKKKTWIPSPRRMMVLPVSWVEADLELASKPPPGFDK